METTKSEKIIIKNSIDFSYDKFWDALEFAAESKNMNEADVVAGLILEGVLYMKQAGMTLNELTEQIKEHYNSFEFDNEGNLINLNNQAKA